MSSTDIVFNVIVFYDIVFFVIVFYVIIFYVIVSYVIVVYDIVFYVIIFYVVAFSFKVGVKLKLLRPEVMTKFQRIVCPILLNQRQQQRPRLLAG